MFQGIATMFELTMVGLPRCGLSQILPARMTLTGSHPSTIRANLTKIASRGQPKSVHDWMRAASEPYVAGCAGIAPWIRAHFEKEVRSKVSYLSRQRQGKMALQPKRSRDDWDWSPAKSVPIARCMAKLTRC